MGIVCCNVLYSLAIRSYANGVRQSMLREEHWGDMFELTKLTWSTLGMVTVGRSTGVLRSSPATC